MSKRNRKLKIVTKFQNKEVRKVMGWMKSLADPPESFRVTENGHYKVRLSQYNRSGELVLFQFTVPASPSDVRWIFKKRSEVRGVLGQNDVDMSLGQIT
jgi:hypothetical protein